MFLFSGKIFSFRHLGQLDLGFTFYPPGVKNMVLLPSGKKPDFTFLRSPVFLNLMTLIRGFLRTVSGDRFVVSLVGGGGLLGDLGSQEQLTGLHIAPLGSVACFCRRCGQYHLLVFGQ